MDWENLLSRERLGEEDADPADFISGMTDGYAKALFKKMSGIV